MNPNHMSPSTSGNNQYPHRYMENSGQYYENTANNHMNHGQFRHNNNQGSWQNNNNMYNQQHHPQQYSPHGQQFPQYPYYNNYSQFNGPPQGFNCSPPPPHYQNTNFNNNWNSQVIIFLI